MATGALIDAQNTTLTDGTFPVHIEATDASAGIKYISVTVDGQSAFKGTKSCSPGPCTVAEDWTFDPRKYTSGTHQIVIGATDATSDGNGNGNSGGQYIHVVSSGATTVPLGPGAADLVSGQFSLSTTDASLATAGPSLTVARSYRSRETVGHSGPLGPGWEMTLQFGSRTAAWQSLQEMANGDVRLVNAAGLSVAATKDDAGNYQPAPGYGVDSVSKTTGGDGQTEYHVTDSSGNATTLRQPDGGGDFLVVSVDVPGDQGATSYSYARVQGAIEPTRILAPAPAGVDCSGDLVAGCRALALVYADTTTASGDAAAQWGDYQGQLAHVDAIAYDPDTGSMRTIAVAQYAYDGQGRLRAAWDPRISPALKTTYGYDRDGHVGHDHGILLSSDHRNSPGR